MVSLDGRKAALFAGLALALLVDHAAAQQPSPDQVNAIRQSCRSDFMSNCSGVQPGGKDAIECLERNVAKLSAPCKTAVTAIAKPAAPAAPPRQTTERPAPAAPAATTVQPAPAPAAASVTAAASAAEQLGAVQKACTMSDFTAHCSWIQPNSPEVLLCLQANAAELSPGCQTAVRALPPAATPAPVATATAPAPIPAATGPAAKPAVPRPAAVPTKLPQAAARTSAPPAAAAPARQPTPEQLSAIRSSCRSDFISHCSGVQPGGAEALQCLQRNAAQLSAPCKGAVAAIAGGAPAASAAATGNAAAPAAAPLAPMPQLRLVQELAILRVCGADQRALCGGIPPGGGRIIACLAQNASSLSPQCYGALAESRR